MKFNFIKFFFSIFIINNFLSAQTQEVDNFVSFAPLSSEIIYGYANARNGEVLEMNSKGNGVVAFRSQYDPYAIHASLFDSSSNSWSNPTTLHTNPAGRSISSETAVSISENNDAVVTWRSYSAGNKWMVLSKVYDSSANTWGKTDTLSNTSQHGQYNRVVMFDNGDALAVFAWYTGNRYRQYWTKYTESSKSWSTAALHGAANDNSYNWADLVYNSTANKVAHMFVRNVSNRRVAYYNIYNIATGQWGTEASLSATGQSVQNWDYDMADNGNMIAAWTRYNGTTYVAHAKYYTASNNSWSAQKDFTSSPASHEYNISASINNTTGDATVMYSKNGDRGFYLSQFDVSAGSWSTTPTELPGVVNSSSNDANDILDNKTSLILMYNTSESSIAFKTYTYASSSWSDPVVIKDVGRNYVKLAGSKKGTDYMAYIGPSSSGMYYSNTPDPEDYKVYHNNTNTRPTVTASTYKGLNEDAIATVATSELNYSSTKSLNKIRVTTLPQIGNLFLDSNLNGSFDETSAPFSLFQASSIKDASKSIQTSPSHLYNVEIGYVDVHPNGRGNVTFTYNDNTVDVFQFYGNGSITYSQAPSNTSNYTIVARNSGNNQTGDPSTWDRNYLSFTTKKIGLTKIDISDDDYAEFNGLLEVSVNQAALASEIVTLDQVISATDIGANKLKYYPGPNIFGETYFGYKVSDGKNYSTSEAQMKFQIISVNDAPNIPTLSDVVMMTNSNKKIKLFITDVDGDALTTTSSSSNSSIATSVSNDSLVIAPATGLTGASTITISSTDGIATTTAKLNVLVSGEQLAGGGNKPVLASIANMVTNEDIPVIINLSAADTDNDFLYYFGTSDTNSTVTVHNNALKVTPKQDWYGTTSIMAFVTDFKTTPDTSHFTVTVNPVNDAPTASALQVPGDSVAVGLVGGLISEKFIHFIWDQSIDVENDDITYELKYKHSSDEDAVFIEDSFSTADTNFYFPLERLITEQKTLNSDVTYFDWDIYSKDNELNTSSLNGSYTVIIDRNLLSAIADGQLPVDFNLKQNFPNPFNPTTSIQYQLPEAGFITLEVFDVSGRKIKTLINSQQNAGYKTVMWNGTNDAGMPVSTGMYIYSLRSGDKVINKRMTFMK